MIREDLPLVKAVKENVAIGEFYHRLSDLDLEDLENIERDFQQAYIGEHVHGCSPETWIGDNLMQAIINKFKYVLNAVREAAISQTNTPSHYLITMVEPSYEDTTYAAILYDPWDQRGKKALCWFESTRAWRFCWSSEDEMEKDLRNMISEVVMVIQKMTATESSVQVA